jgi:DNA invertase Pin-like site-specific DNA recombinase
LIGQNSEKNHRKTPEIGFYPVIPLNDSIMKVFYSRVSTLEQSSERQLQNLEGFDYVLTDKCSGLIPLYQRPNGSQIRKMIDNGKLTHLEIHSIDRLGRDLISTLEVWNDLTNRNIVIVCRNPHIRNIDENGKVDVFSELMMSILSTMSSFEKSLIKERQMEGIRIRKEKGLYGGRKIGSVDTDKKFLNKPKSQKILDYLNKGFYTYEEIRKILGCSLNTISKVKRINDRLCQLE